MRLEEFNAELNESKGRISTSEKANKLIKRLSKRRDKLNDLLSNKRSELSDEKKSEYRNTVKAIDKAIPVIKEFRDYFQKLETKLGDAPTRERQKKIEAKYDEIKELFIDELYNVMKFAGYNASYIIGAAIATLIFSIFIPGTTVPMLLPTIMLIRNIKEYKEKFKKMSKRQFEKEVNNLLEILERKKKIKFSAY